MLPLVHVTQRANVKSILEHGLQSPTTARAFAARPTFGSEGSRRDVVQLFDLNADYPHYVARLPETLTADAEKAGVPVRDLVVLAIDGELRSHPAFMSHRSVREFCQRENLRYIAGLEAWCSGDVAPGLVSGVEPFAWLVALAARQAGAAG